jgi:peptidoglycan/LPS O-acetylase OafA/YrhL
MPLPLAAPASGKPHSQALQLRGHIPGLDLLRGLAIAMVVTYHGIDGRGPFQAFHGPTRLFVYLTSWGATGVELFFVLSGFLITGILLDDISSPNYYRRFYQHRALRILPAYLLILAVLKLTHHIGYRFLAAALFFIANMSGLVGARNSEYGALWSLAVEEQFYLLWPWLVRRLSLRGVIRLILAFCLFSPFIRALLAVYVPHLDLTYKLWANADWLLSGALVAATLRSGSLHHGNIRAWIF